MTTHMGIWGLASGEARNHAYEHALRLPAYAWRHLNVTNMYYYVCALRPPQEEAAAILVVHAIDLHIVHAP